MKFIYKLFLVIITLLCYLSEKLAGGFKQEYTRNENDGAVRVFTQSEDRFASEEALKTFEEEVNALSNQSLQEIGGYKVSDLPGREALYEPGKRAGQIKMVREPHGVVTYTWVEDGENSHWEKIGDVLGATDKDSSSKTMYEGQHYDFVFSVDVEDGKPPLKLPFNKGDDPYIAAHRFLEKNMLPASYLDQVVEFILKNSRDPSDNLPLNAEYVDPFTGAARYTPGSSGANVNNSGPNVDPFTGSSSYTTLKNQGTQPAAASSGTNADPFTGGMSYTTRAAAENMFFPQRKYITFEMGDPSVILSKLKEFNRKSGDGNSCIDESLLQDVVKLCTGPPLEDKSVNVLFKLLDWPDDVVRLAVRFQHNNSIIANENNGFIIEKLKKYVNEDCKMPSNILVSIRTLCNLCAHPPGEDLIFKNCFELLENVTSLTSTNKNVQIALATFLLNITILNLSKMDDFGIVLLASILPDTIVNLEEPEAQFRALVALGTLLSSTNGEQNRGIKDKIKEHRSFIGTLQLTTGQYGNDTELKRKKCAIQVQNELSK